MTPTEQAARWLDGIARFETGWRGVTPDENGALIPYADALAAIARHLAPGDDLVERHADRERNLLLNTALSDLDNIINYHNPEVDTSLNNLVWDQLDKLAVAIEAKAAVRMSALTAENAELRAILATIVSRCDTAKQQCNDGEPVSAFNLASAILGQIGGYRGAFTDGGKDE
jgi:hypothetical protein